MFLNLFKLLIIVFILFLIPTAFYAGRFTGEQKNAKPILNNCFEIEAENIPYKNYAKIPLERLGYMYRMFYSDKYKFSKIIVPSDITVKEYYNKLLPTGFEFFVTNDEKIIVCGFYK